MHTENGGKPQLIAKYTSSHRKNQTRYRYTLMSKQRGSLKENYFHLVFLSIPHETAQSAWYIGISNPPSITVEKVCFAYQMSSSWTKSCPTITNLGGLITKIDSIMLVIQSHTKQTKLWVSYHDFCQS